MKRLYELNEEDKKYLINNYPLIGIKKCSEKMNKPRHFLQKQILPLLLKDHSLENIKQMYVQEKRIFQVSMLRVEDL